MFHQIDRHAPRILVKLRRFPPTKKFTEPELAEQLEVSTHWLRYGRFRGYGPEYDRLPSGIVVYPITSARDYLKERAYAWEARKEGMEGEIVDV